MSSIKSIARAKVWQCRVHFCSNSVINVMLWAVNDTDCVQGFVRLFDTERKRETVSAKIKPKAKTSFAVASLDVAVHFFSSCLLKVFQLIIWGKLDVDWRTMFENVLCILCCAFVPTSTRPQSYFEWIELESVRSNNHSKFSTMKREKKNNFYKHLKNKRYDPYTQTHPSLVVNITSVYFLLLFNHLILFSSVEVTSNERTVFLCLGILCETHTKLIQ